jgi:hypothetical protein
VSFICALLGISRVLEESRGETQHSFSKFGFK